MNRRTILAVAFATLAAAQGTVPAADREAAARQQPGRAAGRAQNPAIRQAFLEVEKIARLPEDERLRQLPRLYRELAPRVLGIITEGVLSSHPANLLERDRKFAKGKPFEDYPDQLDAAANHMSPEEVAARIESAHGQILLPVATRRRAMQVLARHADATARLVAEDLRSREPEAVARAALTIGALKLGDFLDELVALHLGGGPSADAARSALGTLNDPRAAGPLIADVEKNPAALARHHLLLNGMLDGKPADPVLVRLLSSKDADVRLQSVTALGYCRDDALAPHVLKLLKDPDARVRAGAVRMVFRLPKDGFASVRRDLIGVARDADPEVRLELACGLAARKDPAAADALLDYWRAAKEPNESWRVMQAVSNLTGDTFGYNPREWGPGSEENRKAIAKLEKWARAQVL